MLLLKILNIYDRMLILLYKALRCFVGFIHSYTCTFQFYFIFLLREQAWNRTTKFKQH